MKYDIAMVEICNWCIKLLRDLSAYSGWSYEEINVWLFIIIQPTLIIVLGLLLYKSHKGRRKIFDELKAEQQALNNRNYK
tara:strand:+ start:5047 stop:5286 length:240 start_codon:yes stop_codon:yes gene_type:complete